MIWQNRQPLNGSKHRHPARLIDVYAVNRLGVDLGHAHGKCNLADLAIELFAVLAIQLLRVLEPSASETGHLLRQNHCCGNDGPKERSTPNLIHTCNHSKAVVSQRLLWCVTANKLPEHLLFGRRG